MISILNHLSRTVLEELAMVFTSGRVQPPYSGLSLREWLNGSERNLVCLELERFRAAGMSASQIGIVLDLLAKERARQQEDTDRIQMVWTGPDQEGPAARDTGVVARELLGQASKSLLITTYSISRSSNTFEPVNDIMRRNPYLDVTIVLHVDMSIHSIYGLNAAAAFARDFWVSRWPWESRPKVFYDPRGALENQAGRALQHAKCIVVDRQRVFITSANYTESAQQRNIELGVVIRDERLAERVSEQFHSLIGKGLLVSLPDHRQSANRAF